MTFSKTTEYALRILTFMAMNENEVVTSVNMKDKLHIPMKYLQRLLTDMTKEGFIKSIRGRDGGFILARDINTFYLSEIIRSTEGKDWAIACIFGFSGCLVEKPCAMHRIWADKYKELVGVLETTSLGDLKNNKT